MPYPHSGESKSDYIERFMRSSEAQKDFPTPEQRIAVAYSMYEKKENSSLYSRPEDAPWPKSYRANFIESGVCHYADLGSCKVCGDQHACGNNGDECQTEGATILVPDTALDRMSKTFIGKPVIDMEHKDVSPNTIPSGEAQGIVTRVWKENGWHYCDFLVWDKQAQEHCDGGLFSVSCAYEPTKVDENEGEYHNIPYSSTIEDGVYTHLAIVQSPRYEQAKIYVNAKSKGGKEMSWKFWERGERKNASPIDPKSEMIDLGGGKKASLQNLYDALPDEEKPKFNDETMLSTPKGDKTLGELKKNYSDKMAKDEEEKKNAEGEAMKPSAPADKGAGNHEEGKGGFEHDGACEHCRHPAFNEKKEEKQVEEPLPDMRDRRQNDAAEEAAKKLDAEAKEKKALELEQAKSDEAAKMEEEKKNALEKEELEKKNAEEKKEKEELANAKKIAGKKSFESLRNARVEHIGDIAKIMPATVDERLAKGKSKYGSPA